MLNRGEWTTMQHKQAQVHEDEINTCKESLEALLTEMQQVYVQQRDVQFTDSKVGKLQAAGSLINDMESLLKGAATFVRPGKGRKSDAASRRA